MSKPEIYVSVDIESNGPIPGPNSMWSIGAAAFTDVGDMHGTFYAVLEDLPDSKGGQNTLDWWARPEQADAFLAARRDPRDPSLVMADFSKWVSELPGKPVFVGAPAGYDFTFVYWYLVKFTGNSPFSFSALDVKSYVSAMLGTDYRKSTKRIWPKRWFPDDHPHTHIAVDDAVEQGISFMRMREENLKFLARHQKCSDGHEYLADSPEYPCPYCEKDRLLELVS